MFDFSNYFTKLKYYDDSSNYSAKSKYYDDSNKLMVCKIKGEAAGVAVEEFVGLNRKMCLYLLDNNSKHKKAKSVNKNVVTTISKYKVTIKMFCGIRNV